MKRPVAHGKLAVFVLTLLPHLAVAQYVELTAELETIRWTSGGACRDNPWKVQCIVGTNSWQMEGIFLQGAKSTAWFTGSHIVLNHELSKPVEANQRLQDTTDGPDRFVQVATSSGQRWTAISESMDGNPGRPVRQADRLTMQGRIAWLAFCSGSYLKREGRVLYPPSDLWKALLNVPAGFPDRTVVFEDGLGLPKSVRLETTDHSPIMEYGVVGSTNVSGWEFPREFYLAQYRPAGLRDSGRIGLEGWEVDFIVRGRVTAIGPGPKPEVSPEILAHPFTSLAAQRLECLTANTADADKLKMTDFNIDPPVAKTVHGPLELSCDEVAVSVEGTASIAGLFEAGQQAPESPLSVLFLGYTNGMGASVISNRCNRTVKVWAAAWVEVEPFSETRSDDWIWVIGPRDQYLDPGQALYWTFIPPALQGTWRLRIPWSEEDQARIVDWARGRQIGEGLRAAPENYAASAAIEP